MTRLKPEMPRLSRGSKIGITSTARKISPEELQPFLDWIADQGWEAVLSDSLFLIDHQFAGKDEDRAQGLQDLLNRDDLDAIWFARGGYGTVRILDRLDFNGLRAYPKWLIGYSDVTALHLEVFRLTEIPTLHATMSVSLKTNTPSCLTETKNLLEGKPYSYQWNHQSLNRTGRAQGQLLGGNLSMIYSLLGSSTMPNWKGKILFLEDLDEYLYHIDRMMMNLKRNGIFENIAGLVVGGMSDMNDNAVPFGKTPEEIIREHVEAYDFPVAFGLSAGHLDHNLPLIFGESHILEVNRNESRLHPQDHGISQQNRKAR